MDVVKYMYVTGKLVHCVYEEEKVFHPSLWFHVAAFFFFFF